MTFLELAERCEAASGPSRELDGLIEVARDPMRETILYNEPGRFPQKSVRGPIKDLQLNGRDLADYISAPPYTSSLDAAMTLVRDGAAMLLSSINPDIEEMDGRFHALVGDRDSTGDPCSNATPALALCAAALKDSAASGIETEGGDAEQAPGDSLSSPTAASGDAQPSGPILPNKERPR